MTLRRVRKRWFAKAGQDLGIASIATGTGQRQRQQKKGA